MNRKTLNIFLFLFALGLVGVNVFLAVNAVKSPTATQILAYSPLSPKDIQQKQIVADLNGSQKTNVTKDFFAKANRLSRKAGIIKIEKCESIPAVAKTALGNTVTFLNPDDSDHLLIFTSDKRLLVPARNKATLKMDFFMNPPVLSGYSCDYSEKFTGAILIQPKPAITPTN